MKRQALREDLQPTRFSRQIVQEQSFYAQLCRLEEQNQARHLHHRSDLPHKEATEQANGRALSWTSTIAYAHFNTSHGNEIKEHDLLHRPNFCIMARSSHRSLPFVMFSSVTLFWLAAGGIASAYTVTNVDSFMHKNIDPIVIPGQYKSHLHNFFGSDAVTVDTTTSAELQAGCSTAQNPNDFSIYWIPVLLLNNADGTSTVVDPMRFSAYYVAIESAEIAIPQNFKQIAGNSKATTQAELDSLAGAQWFCEGSSSTANGVDLAEFPTETCATHLQTLLLFHDCVNPDTLESAYSGTQNWVNGYKAANRCPPNMKRMPQLRFSIRYDLRKLLPKGWSGAPPLELASGSSFSTHGDFINGWLPEAAENMLLANSKSEFAGVDGPNGAYDAGSVCDRQATDADPDNGTSDFAESEKILSTRSIGGRKRWVKTGP